ncbi:DNA-directed RNA polymerase III subunit RPC4 [Chanos chanos]|uniref:DNA-directed RNA polymerase III subunit RPC4 n=1 Tax=Chanos chanos TaxID=29144 RepID=A0A6J2VAA1_CHACN|nr:DNA-directed RNA polymerase III subunit RPC4-like [Chanos chanos]
MSDPSESDPVTSPYDNSSPRPPLVLGRGLSGRLSLTPPPPGRLTSLRSRDLTLGGFKKKTFVPNVHSVRKSKDELKEELHAPTRRERREREDRQRDSKTRRRERPQTIQSHSIFEQGPADTIRKIGGWGGANLTDCESSPVTKCIKKEKNVTEDADNEILQKLQRDDFLDDPGLKNDDKLRPIQLPLHQSSNFLATETSTLVKEETTDYTRWKSKRAHSHKYQPQTSNASTPEHPTVGELFQQLTVSDKEELFFMQLPDTIPARPKTINSEKPAKKESKSEDKRTAQIKTQDAVGKESRAVLSDFSEGLIGKLQIRKSGKVQLVLGGITLDVSEGAAFSFLQQLVSVRLSEGMPGDLCVLGNIRHKLVCSPDFEALLKEVKSSSNTNSGQS